MFSFLRGIFHWLYEGMAMSVRAIAGFRTRAVLTTLGITIGIFSITFIFTLVNTLQYVVSKNLAELGNTVMFVHHWPWMDGGDNWYKYFNRPKASYSDFVKLKTNLEDVEGVAYQITRSNVAIKATNGKNVQNITTMGVSHDYNNIIVFGMQDGRYFTPHEIEAGRNVCLIGVNIAQGLFGEGPYVGQNVRIRGRQFRVLGVMDKQGINAFGGSRDDIMVMPYTVMTQMVNSSSRQVDKVISIKANSYDLLDKVQGNVIGLVRQVRGLKPGKEDNFSINRQEMLMAGLQSFFSVLRNGGIVISLFSLLVGGFGIANIMFVSVRERTSEIGVQKALGATKGFIQLQFLLEAITLCVAGGLLGILAMLGVAGSAQLILNAFTDWGITVSIVASDLVMGVIISILIGLVSGFVPAYTAANMDPVEAIRQQ